MPLVISSRILSKVDLTCRRILFLSRNSPCVSCYIVAILGYSIQAGIQHKIRCPREEVHKGLVRYEFFLSVHYLIWG